MPLTRDEYLDSDPWWSPDGKQIVFATDRGGEGMDLWRKNADGAPGTGAGQLTALPGAEVNPVWSPDGRFIAFTNERDDLFVMPAAEGTPRLLRQSRHWAGAPSWSSDSRHLALAVLEPHSSRFREGDNRILVISAESGAERLVDVPGRGFGTREGDGPVWSPDGRKMAFAGDGGLWVLPVTPEGEPTGEPRRVLDEPVAFPSWSPDSESLIFVASEKLERVDIASGAVREIPLYLSYRIPLAGGRMVIRNARVIDGTGGPPQESVDIVIEGDRIESLETGGTAPVEGVRVIDASGKTVIPGLIEMHTHPALPVYGSGWGRIWLAFGVTSIRSVVGSIYRTLEERESIRSGRRIGPRVFFSGYSLDGDRIYYREGLSNDDEEKLGRELDRGFRLDFDLFKTYVRLSDVLQKKVVEEAHRKGVFVTSHEIYPAVAYGVDGIEHVRGTSRRGFSAKLTDLRRSYGDVRELVARSGVYFTPMLQIEGGFRLTRAREPELLDDPRLTALLPAWALEGIRRGPTGEPAEREEIMKPLFDTVGAIHKANGRLVAGTDSPIVPYGFSLILEIEQLSEAGLGPLQAIRAATRVAARALGVSDDLGTVRAGKIADLVILGGDPTEDIRNLRRVEKVILAGRLVSVDQLLATH